MNLFVTGGAGFIGSHFAGIALRLGHRVTVFDSLTYAGNLENVSDFEKHDSFHFIKGDIRDAKAVLNALDRFGGEAVVNFAAESHVDRSIENPAVFLDTNVQGTGALLDASLAYTRNLTLSAKSHFRFLHVSTDEVFGSLGPHDAPFDEGAAYRPNSPYAASKAASDHLARAWFRTYGLPTIVTHCSNNYGPRQYPEKLIPHLLFRALSRNSLPVYGNGENIRDWIYVEDHCHGLLRALERGTPGESYGFGGRCELKNIEVVRTLCELLNRLRPREDGIDYGSQIQFVEDRPGHDLRYAIVDAKAERELGFERTVPHFRDGLERTVRWYLDNLSWSKNVFAKGSRYEYDWHRIESGGE